MLPETMYEMSMVYTGRMDAAWLYPRNLIQWTDEMQARDGMGSLDGVEYYVMVNMAAMMIRGLGEILQQTRNLAVSWKPMAERALRERGKLAEVEVEIASWTAK